MDTVYTAKQVAEMMDVDIITIYRYIKNGKLGGYRVGRDYRITDKDLYEYVEKHKVKINKK